MNDKYNRLFWVLVIPFFIVMVVIDIIADKTSITIILFLLFLIVIYIILWLVKVIRKYGSKF